MKENGSSFRSREMKLVRLFLQIDNATQIVEELLHSESVEFRDINHTVNVLYRRFTPEIRRWDEVERKITYLREELKTYRNTHLSDPLTAFFDDQAMSPSERISLDEIESATTEVFSELQELRESQEKLTQAINENNEVLSVLAKDTHFFEQYLTAFDDSSQAVVGVLVKEDSGYSVFKEVKKSKKRQPKALETYNVEHAVPHTSNVVRMMSGVISRSHINTFSTILWRATRGNVFVRFSDIEEPFIEASTGEHTLKSVFILFFQSDALEQKIRKVAGSLSAKIFEIPVRMPDRISLRAQSQTRQNDLQTLFSRIMERRRQILVKVAGHIGGWSRTTMKRKAVLHVLNMCNHDVSSKCLIGEVWCPEDLLSNVRRSLQSGMHLSGTYVPSFLEIVSTAEVPPTYNRLNDLTRPFQLIVDAYGVPRFQEINPGPFTIITFPFLFAVMFGDVGHGFMMLLFSLYLVFRPKSILPETSEVISALVGGRYMLLLMSFFSIYVGAIYGEAFSLPIPLFPSGWEFHEDSKYAERTDWTYPFGVDYNWIRRENDLEFFNSLKMKLSIILGVAHMLLGIVLSCFNHVYFKRWSNIICDFLPQLLFMLCIFGYMVFLIILKWFINWEGNEQNAPLLVNTMIDMFLHPGLVAFPMFPNQAFVQNILVIVALLCIPWMLLAKPLVSYLSQHKHGYRHVPSDEESTDENTDSEEEGHSFGDEFTHQVIHTIEYALGTVSNTASYLRLWALSLAHSELSKVFWDQIMLLGIQSGNMIMVFICFAIWATVTVGVMLMMESLSAFLHALRLHWVEFQNKFYSGDGVAFNPTTFESVDGTLRPRH